MSAKILPTKDFVEKAISIHRNIFDYTTSIYKSASDKIEIKCKKHGEFSQLAKNHLKGTICPKCSIEDRFSNRNDFVEKAISIHRNIFDYTTSIYKSASDKIEIKCKKCCYVFRQTPNNHLRGNGCPNCKNKETSIRCSSNTEEFIKKANELHKNKYDYSKTNYINNSTKITIICKKHGDFEQIPSSHLNKSECSKCVSVVSKPETEFLNMLNVKNRQKHIKPFRVDGVDFEKKIIYEFLGDYWHGNPIKFKADGVNQINKKTFGNLYDETFKKFDTLKNMGYTVKYIWENDWNNFKNGIDEKPKIIIL